MSSFWLLAQYDFSIISIVILGLISFRFLSRKEILLLVNCLVILCFDYWASHLAIRRLNNGHVYFYLLAFETTFYVAYLNSIIKSLTFKRYLTVGYLLLIGYWCYRFIQNPKSTEFIDLFMIQAVLLAVFFIYYLIFNPNKGDFFQQPTNWIALGSAIYFCGSIPFHALYDYLISSHIDLHRKLFLYFNLVLSHLRYIMIFTALILLGIQQRKAEQIVIAHE